MEEVFHTLKAKQNARMMGFGCLALCGLCVLMALMLPIPIASMVIAGQFPDVCIGKTMNLDTWLMVSGVTGMAKFIAFIFVVLCSMASPELGSCMGSLVFCINALFSLVWFAIGIVVLVETAAGCTASPLWAMAITAVVFKGLVILG